MRLEGPKILFQIPLFGGINVTETVVTQFGIVVVVAILSLILTHKLEKIPRKKTQIIAEKLVMIIDNLTVDTMGKSCAGFAPYMMALFASSILGSLCSLIGFRSTTMDVNTPAAWALVTVFFIHYMGFKTSGFKAHMHSFIEPYPFPFLIINLISEVATPVSMTLRHFGNIIAGSIIMTLLYSALGNLSAAIGSAIPFMQIGLPAVLSLYFDLFGGVLQAFIFMMLTMVFIGNNAPQDE